LLLLVAAGALYFASQHRNPPAFYRDESSIALNAWLIAREGIDEHGQAFPLFFKAFGEYKNPTYIYLLAGILEVTGPSNLAARRFSAVLGFAACLVMALLAWRMTRSAFPAAVVFLTTAFTPLLFEVSRLAFEVAIYPLLLATFLYVARVASERARWSAGLIVALVATLSALTYSYSIGRLLGPALVAALLIFRTRERMPQILAVIAGWIVVAAIPMVVFNAVHDGALTTRFNQVTYIDPAAPIRTLVEDFPRRFLVNLNPIRWSLEGDPNPRHHVAEGGGSILAMTFGLAGLALLQAWRTSRRDRWVWFLCYAAAASIVPAALTRHDMHGLRMVGLPLFLIALSIPALEARTAVVKVLLAIGAFQALFFMVQFHRHGAKRLADFDHGAASIVREALRRHADPVWVVDKSGSLFVHAWWYGALEGVPRNRFRAHRGERGLVITDGAIPEGATLVERDGEYAAYSSPTAASPLQ
jgi:4-amino-4-deoxy-L-arabinose transferase-like glycosyltransferase